MGKGERRRGEEGRKVRERGEGERSLTETGFFHHRVINIPSIQRISPYVTGVTVNLFRRNLFASGFVPDFQKISEFVPDGQRSMIL